MESVIIAFQTACDERLELRFQRVGRVEALADGGYVWNGNSARVYLRRDDSIAAEFEPGDLERYDGATCFYVLDFTDIEMCKRVIEAVADDPELIVDNDRGMVVRGDAFVRLLKERPTWDWRVEPRLGRH